MADQQTGWYYLHPNGQHYGPYTVPELHGLYSQGLVLPDSLIWREGEAEWLPLKGVQSVQEGLPAAPPAAADGAPTGAASGAAPPPSSSRRAVQVAGAAATRDALDLFREEISALEAQGGDGGDGADAPPSPEERRFEDDDGTWYVWDSGLRKYAEEGLQPPPQQQPAGGQQPGATSGAATAAATAAGGGAAGGGGGGGAGAGVGSYNETDMVFEADDEVIPEYRPPRAGGEGDDDLLEALEKEKGGKEAVVGTAPEGEAEDAGGEEEEGVGTQGKQRKQRWQKKNAKAGGAPGAGSKRKGNAAAADEEAVAKKAKQQEKEEEERKGWFDLKVNTSVYVTGLPEDVTEAELADVFGKCGIIKEGEDRRPKVKVYRDRVSGIPKGDGLVTYLKEPSVLLATQILDGAPFRPGMPKNMTVTLAKFEQKGDYVAKKKAAAANKKKKKKGPTKVEKQLGWDGFDDIAKPTEVTVVLKHMFHPDDFISDPGARKDLERDVADECKKLGSIANIRIHQYNPEGVVVVRFLAPEAAQQCLHLMHGRFFGGRQLEAALWDGVSSYHVRPPQETEEEEQARLDKFARELEAAAGEEEGGGDGGESLAS